MSSWMSLLPGRSSSDWSWSQLSGENTAHISDTVRVLELCRLQSEKPLQRLAMGIRGIGPIGLDRIPELFQSLVIGVAVLDDQTRDALGVLQGQPPTHRR